MALNGSHEPHVREAHKSVNPETCSHLPKKEDGSHSETGVEGIADLSLVQWFVGVEV